MDESNTLINNSEAGLSVHNNSQWHPGFSTLGSVPGMLPTGTMPPAIQTAGQAAAAISPDQDFEIEDEAEDEDEVDEEMDETDYLDDAFDEDALDEDEDAIPPSVFSHTVDATENYHLPSGESSIPESEDSDLPDLEEIPVIDQTDQQMTEGNEWLQHGLILLANSRLRSGRRREHTSLKNRENIRSDLGHHTHQVLRRSTFQPTSSG